MLNVIIKASSRYPIRRKVIKRKIEEILEEFQVEGNVEVEVNIIGDRKMRQMKKKYLGIDETTDVISFPLQESLIKSKSQSQFSRGKHGSLRHDKLDLNSVSSLSRISEFVEYPDGVLRLGSIFISYPQAQRQANLHKLLIDEEIDQLVEHGMMHLLGIHHE